MAYTVVRTDDVKAYLRSHPNLSRDGRVKLNACLMDNLQNYGDQFREQGVRIGPDLFRHEIVIMDGGLRCFLFVVQDSAAAFGVLEIVFADEV